MSFKDILTAVAAFITSVAGAGAIILGVSGWLGKVLADRLMEAERQKHSTQLEQLRSDLKKQQDSELEQLRLLHTSEIDVLIRRREVYQRMATSMRVLLSSTTPASEDEKKEFLKAYDVCYL
jgi:hypothetical protein